MILNKSLILKDSFYNRFKDQIIESKFLKKNDKIIIAVSGGLDSITLFILLYFTGFFKLIIGHINHNLRKDSDDDQLFVQELCKEFDIPFFLKRLDSKSRSKSESFEEWARIERYSFLNNLSEKTNSKWIMTAHHSNDQVETILMNLSRQTGVSGLKGISKKHGKIIRPLLGFSKQEIIDFRTRIGYSYIDDPTNKDVSIPRNFLRNKVLKPWEDQVPKVIKGISQSAQHFQDWENALDYLIVSYLMPKIIKSDVRFEISYEVIKSMPKMAMLRLVKLLINNKMDLWSKHQLKMLNQFLNNNLTGNLYKFSNGWYLLHDRDVLIGQKNPNLTNDAITIKPNQSIIFNKYELKIIIQKGKVPTKSYQNIELVDWSKLKNQNLKIRIWKHGDYFHPLGMKGKQKISDFLVNEKVDRISKFTQCVLTANGKIAWVCGRRIADWVKITKKTSETANLVYAPI